MQMRIESFESEVIWMGAVKMVQSVTFLLYKHERTGLGYLVPTFKERKEGERQRREPGQARPGKACCCESITHHSRIGLIETAGSPEIIGKPA